MSEREVEMVDTLTKQAKDRCKDCFALIDKACNVWWCDEGDCPIENITKCDEWTDPGVGNLYIERI